MARKSLVMISALGLAWSITLPAQAAPISDSDIDDSYAAQEQTARTLADLELELTRLAQESDAATAAAAEAEAASIVAQSDLSDSISAAVTAQEKANAAKDDLDVARRELGSVSQAMYKNQAGEVTQSYYLFGADSVEDANRRSQVYGTLANSVDSKVQRFQALEEVARVMQEEADAAAEAQAKAADAVTAKADAAKAAADAQQQTLASAQAQRDGLAAELAAQRGTTEELERERLDQLERDRKEKADAAAALVLARAQQSSQERFSSAAQANVDQLTANAAAADAAAAAAEKEAARLAKEAENSTGASKANTEKAAKEAADFAAAQRAAADRAAAQKAAAEQARKIAADREAAARAAAEKAAADKAVKEAADKAARDKAAKDAAAKAEREAQERAAQKAAQSAPSSGSGQDLVNYARQFVGSPYVWGGVSPTSGWDCVGFVWYVHQHFGVTTPRRTGQSVTQFWGAYRQVPASQARPGDVMWWPGHVGIYTGNGMHIAAWNPSMGTQEDAVWGNPIYLRVR
ncbi:MAG: NlpC/P60 family protein [Trueperella sp.]|uniref:C40 family peptidase n=1 Tax=Trueperella sp. TaxID=2699835 RepID=UPI0025FEC2A9|nr:C40 family peptidase [Trueperella sp.]MCI7305782.1 NlpC/P60 family protein [Trueperella sp.]